MSSALFGVIGCLALLAFMAQADLGADIFLNIPGLVIVVGGTVVTALISFSFQDIGRALKAVASIFREPPGIGKQAEEISETARRIMRDVHKAESYVQEVEDPFLRLGLQMVVDGVPLEDMMMVMNWRIEKDSEREMVHARLFRTLAACAPAFGLLGTIVGMVGMLRSLGTGDIAQIGVGMGVAMLATFYGLVLSNMVFKPLAIKLEQMTRRRVVAQNILLEGIALTHLGRSPSMIADTMAALQDQETEETAHDAP